MSLRRSRLNVRVWMTVLLAGMMVAIHSWAVPAATFNIHGQLLDSQGNPLSGTRSYMVQFYDAQVDGNTLGAAVLGITEVSAEGIFNFSVTMPAAAMQSASIWYQLSVDSNTPPNGLNDGDNFANRVKVESVPFALQAGNVTHVDAAKVGDGTVDNAELNALDGITSNVQAQLDAKGEAADLANKANTADVYTKTEADASQSVQDAAIAAKADLSDVYTKSEADASQAAQDTAIAAKANAADVYSKSEADTLQAAQDTAIAAKANAADVYNKSEVDTAQAAQDAEIATKLDAGDFYSKEEIDASQDAQDAVIASKSDTKGPAHIIVTTSADEVENAGNLILAYAAAKALTPHGLALDALNRAVVLVPPGRYNLGDRQLILDTEFVDVVGMSPRPEDHYIYGIANGANTGLIRQIANNVHLENLAVSCSRPTGGLTNTSSDTSAYFPDTGLNNAFVRNCTFKANEENSFSMRVGITYNGTFINCVAGAGAFGRYGSASGVFDNCTAGARSFGANGSATGKFIDCTGGDDSFGTDGVASGGFTNCTGGARSFGTNGTTVSGSFTNCTAGDDSFGSNGTVTGTFTGCVGGKESFGGLSGTTTNIKLYTCRMTGATWTGEFKGRMDNCFWGIGMTCGAGARLYNSTLLGNVDLNGTASGVAMCNVKGAVLNTGSAWFNSNNLENTEVN